MAKILIIEPHPEVRELLVRVVARLGHDALTPESEDCAVPPDLILLEPAGPGTMKAARAARGATSVPVVYVTVGVGDADGLDPVAVLVKPFSLLDLERELVTALELRGQVSVA